MPRILFVEDDNEIAEYVARGLQEEGFLVTLAPDSWRDVLNWNLRNGI